MSDRIDAIEAELRRRNPNRRPLTAQDKAFIIEASERLLPLSPETCRYIGRLLRPRNP